MFVNNHCTEGLGKRKKFRHIVFLMLMYQELLVGSYSKMDELVEKL